MKKKPEQHIRLDERSIYLRSLVTECLFGGGRGHMGSAMSLIEILRVLYDDILKYNQKKPNDKKRDRLILSKKNKIKNRFFFITPPTFLLHRNLIVNPSIFHIQ